MTINKELHPRSDLAENTYPEGREMETWSVVRAGGERREELGLVCEK